MKAKSKVLIIIIAAIGLVAGVAFLIYLTNEARMSKTVQCVDTSVPVKLSEDDATEYNIYGSLCAKGNFNGKTVQVLVPGLTYDHTYWDFPYEPENYSYVKFMVDAGFATFNIDRVGTGKSEKPDDPSVLTVQSQAYAIHQVVEALRRGDIDDKQFDRVIGVGHSLGSSILLYQSATYNDVDGLILTGFLHGVNVPALGPIGAAMYQANQDPKFIDDGLADGYITTQPNTRGNIFYRADTAAPAVIQADETLKQIAAMSERDTIADVRANPYAAEIQVPVLLVTGEYDALVCDQNTEGLSCATAEDIIAREEQHFTPRACLEAIAVGGAGHNVNLHRNASDWYDMAATWANGRIGTHASVSPEFPCE